MPRQLRVEYPGALYHIMSRGDQRDDIFLDEVDRHTLSRRWPKPARRRWQPDRDLDKTAKVG
jgi:hypothetical protein